MRRRNRSLCFVLVGLVAFSQAPYASGQARADEQAATQGAGPTAMAPMPAARASEQQAEPLIEQAKGLFQEGRYREALPLIERAYALTRSARYLFNLGVLHHKLSECEPARDYFERYLKEDATGSAHSQARWALEELYAHCPAPPREEPPSRVTQAPSAAPQPRTGTAATITSPKLAVRPEELQLASPSQRALVFWGSGAAVGVAALVSVGLQSRAQRDIDALYESAARSGGTWDRYEPERAALVDNARLYRQMSILLGIGFGALVGTGTVLWVVDSRSDNSLDVALDTPGISYRGRF